MSEKKHIDYSAADIERYHKGLMSSEEMNALEKAALDDPFLADAVEGYAAVPVNTKEEISFLNKKLGVRINDNKVIPVRKSGFIWLRVAAAFIIIAGAGLLTYNYVFQKSNQDVAVIEKKDTVTNKASYRDTIKVPEANAAAKSAEADQKELKIPVKDSNADNREELSSAAKRKIVKVKDLSTSDVQTNNPAVAPEKKDDIAITRDEEVNKVKTDSISGVINSAPKESVTKDNAQYKYTTSKPKKEESQRKGEALNEVIVTKGVAVQNNKTNYFRGQVMDVNNSPLPFANVTIIPDNIGTYTDAKGNFVLISSDSVMNVKIRSVGFENNTARLLNTTSNNPIVLQQDTKNIPSTVLNTNNPNKGRKRQDNVTMEEPEPADGWYNYDTYIANNIKLSDEIKTKTTPSSEVELSFDISKDGQPVNIKVEKSVCKECDEEAIRLLREGPKWKKKKKNKRAKVLVPFLQNE